MGKNISSLSNANILSSKMQKKCLLETYTQKLFLKN